MGILAYVWFVGGMILLFLPMVGLVVFSILLLGVTIRLLSGAKDPSRAWGWLAVALIGLAVVGGFVHVKGWTLMPLSC